MGIDYAAAWRFIGLDVPQAANAYNIVKQYDRPPKSYECTISEIHRALSRDEGGHYVTRERLTRVADTITLEHLISHGILVAHKAWKKAADHAQAVYKLDHIMVHMIISEERRLRSSYHWVKACDPEVPQTFYVVH